MIISTTNGIDGKAVRSYKGIVTGEAIIGANVLKDFMAGLTDFFGGRSGEYEKALAKARTIALAEMEEAAVSLGANAIIGVDLDYETIGKENGMLMVSATGTAVNL